MKGCEGGSNNKIVVHEFILITNKPPAHVTLKFTVYIIILAGIESRRSEFINYFYHEIIKQKQKLPKQQ